MRCSGFRKSPANAVGFMNGPFGDGDVIVPLNRRVVNVVGLTLLNRLNGSAMASTRAGPPRRNARVTRRFTWLKRYPRPQFHVLKAAMSLGCAGSSGLYSKARSGMSLLVKSLFRSRPWKIDTGSAVRNSQIGDTWKSPGSCTTALALTRCRASVRLFGPNTLGSSKGFNASWIRLASSASDEAPMSLRDRESADETVKATPFEPRRLRLRVSASHRLR